MAQAPVRNIIFMVADGTGPGLWSVAAFASDDLAVARMSVAGLVDTRAASHRVTDSAAGASVYATGERTTNRTISVTAECPVPRANDATPRPWPDGCEPLDTWFRLAMEKGKAGGLVTTTSVVDATPAAFVANSPSRYWAEPIALQMSEAGLAVLLGGGRRPFTPEGREDGRDLLSAMCAAADCFMSAEEFAGYRPSDRPLIGLFAGGDMDSAAPRTISFPDMVEAALARLERSPNGFVAMFESESTDNATHDNEPLEVIADRIVEFDRGVGVALDFARRTPGTLLVVTSDHETGGLTLVGSGTDFRVEYSTGDHTGSLVPLFADGPRAAQFGGFRRNYEIGRMLFDIVREW